MDNLSRVPDWLSDALCCVSTGGGMSPRALYTDGEVFLIDVQRPVILTGIGDLATRSDLLDRSIPLMLTEIAEDNRVDEKRIWRKFSTLQPRILGALLDAMSCGLKNLPTTKLAKSPRMANFARLVVAAAPKMGFTEKQFLDAYATKRAEQHATALESSMIGQLIMKLVVENTPFEGTATSLLIELTVLATETEKKSKYFPTMPRTLADTVRRISPHLRAEGYSIEEARTGKQGARTIKIEWVGKTSSASSASSATAKNNAFFDDVADAGRRRTPSADDEPPDFTADSSDTAPDTDPDTDPNSGRMADDVADAADDGRRSAFSSSSAKKGHDNNNLDAENGSADAADDVLHAQSSWSVCARPHTLFDWDTGETIKDGTEHEGSFDLITTAEHLEEGMLATPSAPILGLDCETAGAVTALAGLDPKKAALDPVTAQIRLVQLAMPGRTPLLIDAFHVPLAPLAPLFSIPRIVVGHNLKFELSMLISAGFLWPKWKLFDTMIASQLLSAQGKPAKGEKRKRVSHALEAVVLKELGIQLDKSQQTSEWGTPELTPQQLAYAAKDAAILLPLAACLEAQIPETGMQRIFAIEMRCLPAVAWMELNGVPIDTAAWSRIAVEETRKARTAARDIEELTGKHIVQSSSVDSDAVRPGRGTDGVVWTNLNSPQQLKALFASRGRVLDSTAEEILTALDDPLADLVLDYRSAATRARNFGESWLKEHIHPVTGRVHASYMQCGSEAGRMSCADPNIQQLPRHGGYRESVRAGAGRAIVKADFSQIELRIAAVMANDTAMLTAFRDGEDVHALTASKVLGIPPGQVSKEQRQLAKALNSGLLYGAGVTRLRKYAASEYGVHLTEIAATAHKNRFFASYPALKAWHDEVSARLDASPRLDTYTMAGRVRRNIVNFTDVLNSPVQGTGADGMKLALALLFEHRHEVPDAKLIGCIHDEMLAECPIDQAEATAAWLRHYMIAGMIEIVGDTVPIEVETTIGRDWAGTPLTAPSNPAPLTADEQPILSTP